MLDIFHLALALSSELVFIFFWVVSDVFSELGCVVCWFSLSAMHPAVFLWGSSYCLGVFLGRGYHDLRLRWFRIWWFSVRDFRCLAVMIFYFLGLVLPSSCFLGLDMNVSVWWVFLFPTFSPPAFWFISYVAMTKDSQWVVLHKSQSPSSQLAGWNGRVTGGVPCLIVRDQPPGSQPPVGGGGVYLFLPHSC